MCLSSHRVLENLRAAISNLKESDVSTLSLILGLAGVDIIPLWRETDGELCSGDLRVACGTMVVFLLTRRPQDVATTHRAQTKAMALRLPVGRLPVGDRE